MMYDSLLSRSFSKHEKKKLGYGGLVICFLFALSLCTVFKPYLGPLPVWNLRLSIEKDQQLKILNETSSSLLLSNDAEIARRNDESINDTTTSSSQELVRKIIRINDSAINFNNTGSSKQIISDGKFKPKNDENPAITTTTSNYQQLVATDIECNMLERSDFCKIKGDIRIDENSSIIYIVSSKKHTIAANNTSWRIRPYARKGDIAAMNNVKEWHIKLVADNHQNIPKCTQNHNIPAVLFSLGGYSGNHFHAITDIIVPLYSTAGLYNRTVQFIVTDNQPWWVSKFKTLLKSLSKYDILDVDKKHDHVHCFTSLTVGLQRYSNKELSIDSSKTGTSMKEFRQLLRSSYSLRKRRAIKIKNGREKRKPRLLIISRKRTRAFNNVDEIGKMAKGLGFKVVAHEPDADVSRSAQVMNSCDVVLGVHGAGLTNIVFLPENAILIQVIPFGGAEWVSKHFFEEPSKDMNIRYLDYKISLEESSLIQQYPSDHVVLKNPYIIQKEGWMAFKSIYFDHQNVNLDLNRFRPTLLKALELLRQ